MRFLLLVCDMLVAGEQLIASRSSAERICTLKKKILLSEAQLRMMQKHMTDWWE